MPPCAHLWQRRPDLDPGVRYLAFVCLRCDVKGSRRFGSDAEVKPASRYVNAMRNHAERERVERLEANDKLAREAGIVFGDRRAKELV